MSLLRGAEETSLSAALSKRFGAYKELVVGSEYYEANDRFLAECREPLADFYGSTQDSSGTLTEEGVDMVVVVSDGLNVHRWFDRGDPDAPERPGGWPPEIVRSLRDVPLSGNLALKINGPRYGGLVNRELLHRIRRIDDKTINPQWLKSGRWLVSDAVLGNAIRHDQADLVLIDNTLTTELGDNDLGDLVPRKPVLSIPIESDKTGSCGSCSIRTCRHSSWGKTAQLSDDIVAELASDHELSNSL